MNPSWGEYPALDGVAFLVPAVVRKNEVSDKDWSFWTEQVGEDYRWEYDS